MKNYYASHAFFNIYFFQFISPEDPKIFLIYSRSVTLCSPLTVSLPITYLPCFVINCLTNKLYHKIHPWLSIFIINNSIFCKLCWCQKWKKNNRMNRNSCRNRNPLTTAVIFVNILQKCVNVEIMGWMTFNPSLHGVQYHVTQLQNSIATSLLWQLLSSVGRWNWWHDYWWLLVHAILPSTLIFFYPQILYSSCKQIERCMVFFSVFNPELFHTTEFVFFFFFFFFLLCRILYSLLHREIRKHEWFCPCW